MPDTIPHSLVRKLGHRRKMQAKRNVAAIAREVLNAHGTSDAEIARRLEIIKRLAKSRETRMSRTEHIVSLVSNKKRLRRLVNTLAGKGPRAKEDSEFLATRLGISIDDLPKVRKTIPKLHITGIRRRRDEIATMAFFDLRNLFLEVTGHPRIKHALALFHETFPQFRRIKYDAIRKRLSDRSEPPRIETPSTFNLTGEVKDKSPWTLLMMKQADAEVARMEADAVKAKPKPIRQPKTSAGNGQPLDWLDAILKFNANRINHPATNRVKKAVGERTFKRWVRE